MASGFDCPVFVSSPPDERLFVVDKTGRIAILGLEKSFLDLSDSVATKNWEQGVLGMAFDPAFSLNGRVFVTYNRLDGSVALARYVMEADTASRGRLLLSIPHPGIIHQGGMLAFGPDGRLYMSVGDADDPMKAQDPESLLGKLLRLDVSGDSLELEVWASGLRSPWRFSFDRKSGDLWLSDVGDGGYEEINVQPADSKGGENYGWPHFEGHEVATMGPGGPALYPKSIDFHAPRLAIRTWPRGAVIGGYVYRGDEIPGLRGRYVYGMFMRGEIWSLDASEPVLHEGLRLDGPFGVTSFGEDRGGELYVTTFEGNVYKIVEGR